MLRGFANLTNFKGRDTRAQFWPHAGTVVFMMMAGGMAVVMPPILHSMQEMQRFADRHPDVAQVTQTGAEYSIHVEGYHSELMPDFNSLFAGMALVIALGVAMLASAVVRRLRDAGVSPLWGALPIPFLCFGTFAMLRAFITPEPAIGWFMGLFINNLLYLGSLVILIVMLCRASRVPMSVEPR